MEARHEIISFDSDSPVRLFMHKLGDVSRHWHESLELLLVLAGAVTIFWGSESITLHPDDMLLINSNVIHELHSDDCVMIAVQIKLSKFNLPPEVLQTLYFDCNSVTAASPERFQTIKQAIASMLQFRSAGGDASLFHNRSLAYQLLSELVQNFKTEKPVAEANTQKHLERLNNILRFIGEHYQEQLTLGQIADREHLSAPYLSSYFERYMGVNFSTYYTDLRLEHAVRDLLHTDIPVEQVALNHGFSDPRAFVRAFKKRYHTVPSAYRKYKGAQTIFSKNDPLLSINYLDFQPANYLHILNQYLPDNRSASLPAADREVHALLIGEVDCTAPGTQLRHTWRTFLGVGRAKELLYAEVQDMLRHIQERVGFQYLRFHGIFADDMLVCRMEKDGSLQFSFTLIDKVLDFILSIGLKPLIQFSFMPAVMASNPNKTIFSSPFTISPPRRMEDWNLLVGLFMSHISSRYGISEVRRWLYSVWNEPDTSIQMFGFEDVEEFYKLYENTWRTVKAFDGELVFGTPSLYPTTSGEIDWMKQFIGFARSHNCMPEFVDIHYYSDDFENLDPEQSTFSTPAKYSGNPDHFNKYITKIQDLMKDEHISHLPLYISEWNLTVSHRHLINDTCFKATYLTKNFLENYDRTEAIGYWSLTDFIEEYQPSHQLFHGGLGLFTANGIKKAHCHAMEMLRQLGNTLIDRGEGWFITRRDRGFSAVLYNYEHFDPLFLAEGFGLTLISRDGVFPCLHNLEVSFTLLGIPNGSYRIRETILNREHGSSFDQWVSMGAVELGPDETEWLRSHSVPAIRIARSSAANGRLAYSAILEPHEVRLVEIIPEDEGIFRS